MKWPNLHAEFELDTFSYQMFFNRFFAKDQCLTKLKEIPNWTFRATLKHALKISWAAFRKKAELQNNSTFFVTDFSSF
jgi:hypothetical protein